MEQIQLQLSTITVTGVMIVTAVDDYTVVNEDGNVNVGNDNTATVSGMTAFVNKILMIIKNTQGIPL